MTYETGYGRPPKKYQFKKGVSGNPGGRPSGSRNRRSVLFEESILQTLNEEAGRVISIREGEKTISMPMAKAIIRSMMVKAAKGDTRAQYYFLKLRREGELHAEKIRQQEVAAAVKYKADAGILIAQRKQYGISGPEILPHPNDVVVINGRVEIRGPASKEEKKIWEFWRAKLKDTEEELRELKEKIKRKTGTSRRKSKQEIELVKQYVDVIRLALRGNRYALEVLEEVRAQFEEVEDVD